MPLRWIGPILLASTFAGWLAPMDARAQDPLMLRDRGNREEGIVARRNTGDLALELIGVHVNQSAPANPNADTLLVSVPLGPADLRVDVREPSRNYVMRPKHGEFRPGAPFSWPSEPVIRQAAIPINELRALVRSIRAENELYYPAALGTSAPVFPPSYEFWFQCQSKCKARWTVSLAKEGRLHKRASASFERSTGGAVRIEWNPDPEDAPGEYVLTVDADLSGRRTPIAPVRFLHYGRDVR